VPGKKAGSSLSLSCFLILIPITFSLPLEDMVREEEEERGRMKAR
jgi:hypothetical protein